MPWSLIITVGYLSLDWVYNTYFNKPTPPPQTETQVTIPLTADGTPIPLIYGRVRVNAPIIAYSSSPATRFDDDEQRYQYMLDMLFVIGVPFQYGTSKIYTLWSGDTRFIPLAIAEHRGSNLSDQDGNGNFEAGLPADGFRHLPANVGMDQDLLSYWNVAGTIEFLNGNPSIQLVDPSTGAPTTRAGLMMTSHDWLGDASVDDDTRAEEPWLYGLGHTDPFQIPGYRGFLCAFHWDFQSVGHWSLGFTTSMSAYSYEVTSYPPSGLFAIDLVGVDCNPVSVIVDLLTGSFGKLGLPLSYIDQPSFAAAAVTLAAENHGYSRVFDTNMTVIAMLQEICLQIDAVLYEDPTTATFKIKLIRADYDTATLPVINPDNCQELQNFAAGGWTDVVNRVVVTFTDRTADYKTGTAVAFSQANAVGQNGIVNEMQVSMPGICNQTLANYVAGRILASASRPLMKCRAIVNRSFLRVRPGDALKLSFPPYNISNVVMRVAGCTLGTLEEGFITLDLVQDYFYTHRDLPPVQAWTPPGGFVLHV